MISRPTLATCLALLLSGCVDEAADLGRTPPSGLVTTSREIPLSTDASGSAAQRLGRGVAAVAAGDLGAVRARMVAVPVRRQDGVRRALVRLGVDPSRITAWAGAVRQPPAVVLTRTAFLPADCRAAVTPSDPDDPLPSLMGLARCHEANDLGAMVADPADLVAPPALQHADGSYLADGVTAWRTERQTGLVATGTTGVVEPAASGPASAAAGPASPPTALPAGAVPTAARPATP